MKKPKYILFRQVCEKKGGNITEIAKAFEVSRRCVQNWLAKNYRFKEAVDDTKSARIDLAESQALNMIKGVPKFEKDEKGNDVFVGWKEKPSEAMIIFTLKTLGKDRGYIERIQTEEINNPFFELMKAASQKDDSNSGDSK